jgi:myosin heavy subunit
VVAVNDTLISVNGKYVYGKELSFLRNMIPGPANTGVDLGFQKTNSSQRYEVHLLRTSARQGRAGNPAIVLHNQVVMQTPMTPTMPMAQIQPGRTQSGGVTEARMKAAEAQQGLAVAQQQIYAQDMFMQQMQAQMMQMKQELSMQIQMQGAVLQEQVQFVQQTENEHYQQLQQLEEERYTKVQTDLQKQQEAEQEQLEKLRSQMKRGLHGVQKQEEAHWHAMQNALKHEHQVEQQHYQQLQHQISQEHKTEQQHYQQLRHGIQGVQKEEQNHWHAMQNALKHEHQVEQQHYQQLQHQISQEHKTEQQHYQQLQQQMTVEQQMMRRDGALDLSATPSIALGDEAGSYMQRNAGVLQSGQNGPVMDGSWERKMDPRGFVFWVDHATKRISYTPPEGLFPTGVVPNGAPMNGSMGGPMMNSSYMAQGSNMPPPPPNVAKPSFADTSVRRFEADSREYTQV